MTNSTYNYIARNGSNEGYSEAELDISLRHQIEAEAFLEAHAGELYEKQDRDERMMVYGAEYFVEVGGDFDDDGDFDVAATIEANDINTDQMDYIESHGIYQMADHTCYREIGTADQRERARDIALIDTREQAVRECRAERATQLARHLSKPAKGRGEQVVDAKVKQQAKRDRARERYLAREAQRAANKAARA